MAKRARGQELGSRRRPAAVDVAGGVVDHDCTSSGCRAARESAEQFLQELCREGGISPKRLPLLKPMLPRLLCKPGAWPPKNVSAKEVNALFLAAVAGCVETNITGMRVQSTEGYARVVKAIREANESG